MSSFIQNLKRVIYVPMISNEKYVELLKAKIEKRYNEVIEEEMNKKPVEIWSTSRIEAMDKAIVEAITIASPAFTGFAFFNHFVGSW